MKQRNTTCKRRKASDAAAVQPAENKISETVMPKAGGTPAPKPDDEAPITQPVEASDTPAVPAGNGARPEAPRPPVTEVLLANPTAEPQEWLRQFMDVLEGMASDLGFIGGFTSFHERQFAMDPALWKRDPLEYLGAVCEFDLCGLWSAMIEEIVTLRQILHHSRDRIYGQGLPLEVVKDEIEGVANILLAVAVKGEEVRREWQDALTRQPQPGTQEIINDILNAADGLADRIRTARHRERLLEIMDRLRGCAVRGLPKLTPAAAVTPDTPTGNGAKAEGNSDKTANARTLPWEESRKGFIRLGVAKERYCTSGIAPKSLGTLSKKCKPDGEFDYMRKPGKGVRVDEQQFAAWAAGEMYTLESVQAARPLLAIHDASPAGIQEQLHKMYDVYPHKSPAKRRGRDR
jgi:hypothetical protein